MSKNKTLFFLSERKRGLAVIYFGVNSIYADDSVLLSVVFKLF